MPLLSDNPVWEAFGTRALFHATYGGSDFGECVQAVQRVGDGDVDEWHREWSATADRLVDSAQQAADAGHAVSARQSYLRASTYYRTAYFPLFGEPVDERLKDGSRREHEALAAAVELCDPPAEMVEIPFEDTPLPGVLVRAGGGRRPIMVHTNGYDSTLCEMFVAHVPAAVERGYHVLLFDGPGQGRNLVERGLRMRPDWENVVTPVIDWVLERPEVDPERVVLVGWSFGGFLAPRAAGREHRLAALIADPGQWDQRAAVERLPLSDEDKARFPDVDRAKLAPMEQWINGPDADPLLRWRLVQRGLWVHGVPNLFSYFAEMMRYELSPVAGDISCPTLLTWAEGDPIAAGAQALFDALTVERKELVRFTAAEGSGGHCEGMARRLYHQRTFDWLDQTLSSL